jgi:hypothetical protein
MADMNEREIIRCFEEIANYDLPAETVEQQLQSVRARLTGQVSRVARRGKWRTILVAAAVIVFAATSLWRLFPSPRLQAAELLTQVARNMEKLAWLKIDTETYGPDQNTPVSVDVHWTDVAHKRVYAIFDKKYIHLMDYERREWWVYRPDTNDMIIQPLAGEWTPTVQDFVSQLKREGISVRQSETLYQGRKATVLECEERVNDIVPGVTNMSMNGKPVKTIRRRFVIDPNRIMGSAEMTYLDPNNRVAAIEKLHMEPVTKGPADIYELGVPRNVKIISKIPDPAVRTVRQKINEYKTQFLNEYIAVITETEVGGQPEDIWQAIVVFRQGKKVRADVYGRDPRVRERLADRYRTELEASSRYLAPFWAQEDERDIRSVRLYDGLWQYVTEVRDDRLVALEKQRRPDGDVYANDEVDDFGWRTLWWMNRPEHMYEDSYSKEHGLVAMEMVSQSGEDAFVMPKRLRLYVDPQKDYLCHRYIEEQLFDAPWQSDKTWLDTVENKRNLREEFQDTEVREYGHTSSGQWYPKVIAETWGDRWFGAIRSDTSRLIRIHLIAEHPEFPAGIFDREKLPRVQP